MQGYNFIIIGNKLTLAIYSYVNIISLLALTKLLYDGCTLYCKLDEFTAMLQSVPYRYAKKTETNHAKKSICMMQHYELLPLILQLSDKSYDNTLVKQ